MMAFDYLYKNCF